MTCFIVLYTFTQSINRLYVFVRNLFAVLNWFVVCLIVASLQKKRKKKKPQFSVLRSKRDAFPLLKMYKSAIFIQRLTKRAAFYFG